MIQKKLQEVLEKFSSVFTYIPSSNSEMDIFCIELKKEDLLPSIKILKSKDFRFIILTDLFAADFPDRENRFEIVYNFLSLEHNLRVVIKIFLKDGESSPSVNKLFSSATWYEREVFDMFGIMFDGNDDMRRILTDYGFSGHPLRKDFPVTGYVEVRYDQKQEKVVYEPVSLDQEFRKFDFLSPWEGPNYILPGDEKATKS